MVAAKSAYYFVEKSIEEKNRADIAGRPLSLHSSFEREREKGSTS